MKLKSPILAASLAMAVLAAVAGGLLWIGRRAPSSPEPDPFTGSAACRPCHEEFHAKWATSWHGLAMRPFTPEVARTLAPQRDPVDVGGRTYIAEIGPAGGALRERSHSGEKVLPIVHVLGGKDVVYLLTPWPGGRLQVLPLAFDVRKRAWYDASASMVRHLGDVRDEALDWT